MDEYCFLCYDVITFHLLYVHVISVVVDVELLVVDCVNRIYPVRILFHSLITMK